MELNVSILVYHRATVQWSSEILLELSLFVLKRYAWSSDRTGALYKQYLQSVGSEWGRGEHQARR